MASLDQTPFAAMLKTRFTKDRILNMAYKDNPLLAMIPKDENFLGDGLKIPLMYGDPQGRSVAFATAQANAAPSRNVAFTLTRVSDYAVFTIAGETIEASKGNEGAFMDAVDSEMERAINAITRSLAVKMYGTGTGTIGQSASTASPVTLQNINDITNFEVGMVIGAVSDDTGSGTVRSGTGTITAINRDTGVITYTGTITSLASGDYLYVSGDYNGALKGLRAWIPDSAPTSTSFFGVDRSVDTVRLGGIRYSASGETIEEALISASARVGREGGRTTHAFANPIDYASVVKAMGSNVMYTSSKVADIGFDGIKVHGSSVFDLYPDINCPQGRMFLLQMDTLKLHTLGKAPKILEHDGLPYLRQGSADGIEGRMAYRGNMSCKGPGFNANVLL